MSAEKPPAVYGGQALIEGVLMRSGRAFTIAVRTPDRSILIETEQFGSERRDRWRRVPLLRGLLVLWESLSIGMRALTFSANAQAEDESERIEGATLTLTMLGSIAIALTAFLLLPAGVAALLQNVLGIPTLLANVIEGIIRLSLLVGYVWSIARMPEIERVYGYHGAEHMTIHAYEDGAELTPDSVRNYPREHPRCGTAFLLTVAILSIVLFSLIGPLPLAQRLASRIVLIPVLASLAYEFIRFTGIYSNRWWAKPLMWPNLALQRITTRPPTEGMIEVALASFVALQIEDAELDAKRGINA